MGKALPAESSLRKKCEDIIAKWKQMLEEEDDEKEEENNAETEKLQMNNIPEGTNNYSANINNMAINTSTHTFLSLLLLFPYNMSLYLILFRVDEQFSSLHSLHQSMVTPNSRNLH